jgi:hypothetical protein
VIFSDKCTLKDIEKMESDYSKDLIKERYTSKSKLSKYLKSVQKVEDGDSAENKDGKQAEPSSSD